MKGYVTNNTDKTITKANISGLVQIIFKDKCIESKNDWTSGFKRKISKSNPWKPNEKIEFYIKTKSIEEIYLQYNPEFVFFCVNLVAEDPIGYKYNRDIKEYNLKQSWDKLRKAVTKFNPN